MRTRRTRRSPDRRGWGSLLLGQSGGVRKDLFLSPPPCVDIYIISNRTLTSTSKFMLSLSDCPDPHRRGYAPREAGRASEVWITAATLH